MVGEFSKVLILLILGLFHGIPTPVSGTFFTAVAPKEIFPNSLYNVSIAVEEDPIAVTPTNFSVVISSGENILSFKKAEINSGSSDVLSLDVRDLPEDYYKLTIKSEAGDRKFEDNTQIYPDRTEKSIFIQTDKQIYKPGETVNFRVLVLNRYFKPFIDDQPVQVKLLDPEKNVIKIWNDGFKAVKGLMSNKLELSTEPNLGEWEIEANSGSYSESLQFQVAQYVLPKFKVEVNLPPYLITDSSNLTAVVLAKYTYGQGLKGECTIKLTRLGHHYVPPGQEKKVITKTLPIDGTAFAKFLDLKAEYGLESSTETEFKIEATVKDDNTGQEQTASGNVKLYQYTYKIEYVNKPDSFQPGLPLKMTFKITTQDNIPIEDAAPDAFKIRHGFTYDDHKAILNSSIPASGLVSFTFKTPSNELLTISYVEVTYKSLEKRFDLPDRMKSTSKIYVQLNLITEHPKINESANLLLRATKEFNSLNYIIYGRGVILESGKIKPPAATKEHEFSLNLPQGSAPEGKIVVYALFQPTNEVVADSVKLSAGSVLQNKLEISLSNKTLEPGEELKISLKSEANSTIAIRGVDQSVLLLKADKDINMAAIDAKLKDLESSRNSRNTLDRGSTAFKVFDQAGLTIITNGELFRHRWEEYEYEYEDFQHVPNLIDTMTIRRKSDSRGGKNRKEEPRVRKNFPETWLWEEFTLGETNKTISLTKVVRDTLTSWMITGYSLHSDLGIGVSLEPQILTTFRPFFISLNLPYSVVKGETLSLQVLVHNYLAENVTARITLTNENAEFEFADEKATTDLCKTQEVEVGPSSVTSVTFVITPMKFGAIMLNVKGVTGSAGDALSRPLMVRPPGQQQFQNRAVLIDLRTGTGTQDYNLTTDFPEKRVAGADEVKITVIADLLGTTVSNLDKLLKMPCGCGEQNMVNFVPDIVILEYLTLTGMLSPELEKKAIKFLESGYQRELTYRHSDGSFSAFGEGDPHGSTWLTAFVVRSFVAARPYITIDEAIISKALNFLTERQQIKSQKPKDVDYESTQSQNQKLKFFRFLPIEEEREDEATCGNFQELGPVLHSEMQGGASTGGLALTAYTLLAFIEAQNASDPNPQFSEVIENGLNYISNELTNSNDVYAVTLSAYTLNLGNHSKKEEAFNKMNELATRSSSSGFVFWEPKPLDVAKTTNGGTKPISVEMTSYALLNFALRDKLEDILPIGKWLLRQRNAEGGFLSTQDTVVGLTALAKFAKMTKGTTLTDIQVKAGFNGGSHDISVDDSNAIVLQEYYFPKSTEWVNFAATGKGTALAQLSWSYYVEEENVLPAFTVSVVAKRAYSYSSLRINLCTTFTAGGISNMVVIEANLPSGFVFEADDLRHLKNVPKLKRLDLDNGGTKLIVYFDEIDKNGSCLRFAAAKVFQIENQAPALVTVYDYYDTTKRAEAFYEIF